jgi:hypothetical protein
VVDKSHSSNRSEDDQVRFVVGCIRSANQVSIVR